MDVRDLLHPFLDGELEVNQNVQVLKHLELCAACRARSESETRLRELVADAAREPLEPGAARALISRALDREPSGEWSTRPRRRWWPAAAAAAAVLALGLALFHLDPFCWWGCPTLKLLEHAEQVLRQDPLPLTTVEEHIHHRVLAPHLLGLKLLGANYLDAAGMPAQPVVRYRYGHCQLCFFAIPGGHVHASQLRRLSDGRDYYVVEEDQGVRFVGWLTADGTLVGCMPCRALSSEELYLAASALRQASSSL